MTAIGYRFMSVTAGRLYTMKGNDWTKRHPRIVEEASRLRVPLIIDAEVVCLDGKARRVLTPCIAAYPLRKR